MYSDGHEVDGSWVLRVYVTDLQMERSLRIKGELHIGGVMLRLVEDLGESSQIFPLLALSRRNISDAVSRSHDRRRGTGRAAGGGGRRWSARNLKFQMVARH